MHAPLGSRADSLEDIDLDQLPKAIAVTSEACLGRKRHTEGVQGFPQRILMATLRLKLRKTGWWQEMERNLYRDQESLIC